MTTLTFTAAATAAEINRAIGDADGGEPLEIVLAAGVYTLDRPIRILRDDVTLRGAGIDQTILKVAELEGGNAQALEVSSRDEAFVSTLKASTTADSTTEITLNSTAGISVGTVIKIEQDNTPEWFAESGNTHLDAGVENSSKHVLRQMLAEVTAVDGNRLTLRTATPYAFTGSDSGEPVVARVSVPDLLQGLEISDFTITTDLPGTPDKDNFSNVDPAYDSPVNNSAVEITGVRGLKLHDIRTLNTASTAFDLNKIYGSTIDDLEASGSFNKGINGNGYAFLLKTAFNNVLTDLTDRDMRHSLIFGSFTAEHFNTVYVASTNRDINFHGSPDSRNTIVIGASRLDFPQFEGSKSAVQVGNRDIHPRSTVEANDVTFKFLSGSYAQDVAHGHNGGSEMWGNQNGDRLYGGDGADILSGGIDNDWLEGNGGQDRFIFRRAYEQDRIADFETGAGGDMLDLSKTGIASRDGLSSRQLGSDMILSLGGGDKLILAGIDAAEFAAMNIRFDSAVRDNVLGAWGSDLGFSGGAGRDNFALRPSNFTNGSKPDLLGGGGTDTLTIISGSSFDATLAGRVAGMDVIDATQTPNLAQLSLNRAFAAQADEKFVTLRADSTGLFLKTGDISDWNAVRLASSGRVQLSSEGTAVSAAEGWSLNIIGGATTDSIKGRGGHDRIDGGGGKDNLAGGGGHDAFVFTKGASSASADIITDFANASGNDDRFELESDLYPGLYEGWLSSSRFKLVSGPNLKAGVDGNDRLLYDRANGDLFFDRDGSGDDYGRLKIAELDDGTALSPQDFLIL